MGNWTDPATLTNEQIEAELSKVELKLGEALGSEGVSLRQGNGGYGRSKRLVRGASDEIKRSNPRSDAEPAYSLYILSIAKKIKTRKKTNEVSEERRPRLQLV